MYILNILNKTRMFISGKFWVESGKPEPKAHLRRAALSTSFWAR